MVEVMKIMVTSFKSSHALQHSVPPTLQQAIVDPRLPQRLLDTHRQVWVSLLWGHCSFLLCPGIHKFLFVPSKSLFPQSCVSSGGSGGVSGNIVQRPMPYPSLLHTEFLSLQLSTTDHNSSGDTQTQFCLSLCGVSGFCCTQGVLTPLSISGGFRF